MAITVSTQILGQQMLPAETYCYLYEPLKTVITESNMSATKIFVDMIPINIATNVAEAALLKYGEYDLNPGNNLTFDVMSLARQHHDAGLYRFSNVDRIVSDGHSSIVSKFKYRFDIYSDVTGVSSFVKNPIIGGRLLEHFTPGVDQNQPTNEFEYYGLDQVELRNRWNHKVITTTLAIPTALNSSPTLAAVAGTGCTPEGGFLIWKSRFSGWMFWGFDLKQMSYSKIYKGSLEVGMFESTEEIGGDPFIPVDYTSIDNSYSMVLKSLSLSSAELLAVSGIHASPAVYYSKPGSDQIELMRLASANIPLSSQASGGDFSVSLKSISNTSQKTT